MAATDNQNRRPSVSTRAFASFFQDKLRPAIDDVGKQKGTALKISLLTGVGVFIVFGVGTYLFFAPYSRMLGDHQIAYWPILILLPTTMAVIAFSIAYILSLRGVVREFRENLVNRMAEYIDPGIVHEANRHMPEAEINYSLLFDTIGQPISGSDFFRGRAGEAQVEFTDLRVAAEGGGKKGEVLSGLFFRAVYGSKFRSFMQSLPDDVTISISGLTAKLRDSGELSGELVRLDDSSRRRQAVVEAEWQGMAQDALGDDSWTVVTDGLKDRKVRTLVSLRGGVMSIAMLSWKERLETPGVFDGFDFGNCREFCRDARLCIELAREMGAKRQLFAE